MGKLRNQFCSRLNCDNWAMLNSNICRDCEKADKKKAQVKRFYEKQREYRRKPIKKTSPKKDKQNRELKKVCGKKTGEYNFCSGCGRPGVPNKSLDPSHIIKRSLRPDLITEPENLVWDCRACHVVWDDGPLSEKIKLANFSERISYMKKADIKYFYRWASKHGYKETYS